MCGIAGILLHADRDSIVQRSSLIRMRDCLKHRGPDDSRIWVANNQRAGLVHTRLSIVDLSDTGSQPMVSIDGRYQIVFNGEIYNHVELRRQLEANGHHFRGTSDTEVLLQLFIRRGMNCLNLLDGMFAFAVYDDQEHQMWLARDPLGEKPLYIVERDGVFAFASEARALVAGGVASQEADIEGITYLLRQGSIPPPYTHLRDIRFLPPATWHCVDSNARRTHSRRYWTIPFLPEEDAQRDRDAAIEELRATLHSSVALRRRADVPVGAFLSGGVDSTAVCAALVESGHTDLRTFTVTLPGHPSDECARAKQIARHLGLEHTEIPIDANLDNRWLNEALTDMDVPSIDGHNTWLVSRAVRAAGMKVACSGIGGDELFFGYPSFRVIPAWRRRTEKIQTFANVLRRTAKIASCLPPIPRWSRMLDALFAGGSIAALWFAKRGLFAAAEVRELLIESVYTKARDCDPIARIERHYVPPRLSPERQVSCYELGVYMHDQLLRDTDTMSMAHGLEVRVPLIARPLVELVASFASSIQNNGSAKSLLRSAIVDRVPAYLTNHPKQGFSLNWQAIWDAYPPPGSAPTSRYINTDAVLHMYKRMRQRGQRRSDVVPPYLVLCALDKALETAARLAD